MKKKVMSLILAIGMVILLCPQELTVWGADAESYESDADADGQTTDDCSDMVVTEAAAKDVIDVDDAELADPDELLLGYFDEQLTGGYSIALSSDRGDSLSGNELIIYTQMKTMIQEVAAGNRASTKFEVEGFTDNTFTMSDLGLSDELYVTDTDYVVKIVYALADKIDLSTVMESLLADCPYDLYWYDKTVGVLPGYSFEVSEVNSDDSIETITWTKLTLCMTPSTDYADGDPENYTVNDLPFRVSAAKEKIIEIVDENVDKSDYEKLLAYKTAICGLTAYNNTASSYNDTTSSSTYGDPWQVIYVFDGDESTNVVCEGYAKAFKYLCDLSDFTNEIDCYLVTGTISSSSVTGGHMWNIVRINEESFFVDLTEADYGYGTFLLGVSSDGVSGNYEDGYQYTDNNVAISYTYDDDTKALYDKKELTLADHNVDAEALGKDNQDDNKDSGTDNQDGNKDSGTDNQDSSADNQDNTKKSCAVTDKNHSFGAWTTTKSPTATKTGTKTRTCSLCGKTETQSIAALGYVSMYRLYNPNSGEHFYTANVSEKNYLASIGWKYEGVGWKAPKSSSTPVYRLYNANGGEHHYTTSAAEKNQLVALGWKYEGIGWYSDDSKGVPLYRQYNPNAYANNHNYTASKTENDWLVSLGWKYEGIGWYGVR